MLGCLKIRAVPVNVNFRYVAEELRYLYDNADLVAARRRASSPTGWPPRCGARRSCAT